ncbi:MAG: phosphoribosyl-AMP cyclohydrolase [Desulfosarcina sp.]|nr:phosphoribosyl-AMP cyclohydrolase [Desulfobacterales bacterium]
MVKLNFNKADGLIPVITQDYKTGEVLMLAYMNQDAWEATISSGKATYFSRSRQSLWVKGETSGNLQMVKEIRIDCDEDTVLLKVEQIGGAACHKGYRSCFFRQLEDGSLTIIGKPVFNPDEVYKK